MDVRDYLAGMALAGLMQKDQDYGKGKNVRKLATAAYQIADAMLEAREHPSQPVLLVNESGQAEDEEAAPHAGAKDDKKSRKGKKSGNGKPEET